MLVTLAATDGPFVPCPSDPCHSYEGFASP